MPRKPIVACFLMSLAACGAGAADPLMGNWEGRFITPAWENMPVAAKVIGRPENTYRIIIEIGSEEADRTSAELEGKRQEETASFSGTVQLRGRGAFAVSGQIRPDAMTGRFRPAGPGDFEEAAFELNKVFKKSPTLNAPPPEDAVVLFDGTSLDAWHHGAIVDGAIQIGGGGFVSKQEFSDCEIHVEFRTPYMPWAEGQGRGNSGVYVQGRYEVQVLDSFGDPPADNRCGGIYKVAAPKKNVCLPPLEWQTYDIVFRAPRFDGSGRKTRNAEVSVRHNGAVIHDEIMLPHPTPGGISDEEAAAGPLYLQNHENPVQYRNIWVRPIEPST